MRRGIGRNGQTLAGTSRNYTYDSLSRLTAKTFTADPAENVTYTYDQAGVANGVGRLTSVTDQSGVPFGEGRLAAGLYFAESEVIGCEVRE